MLLRPATAGNDLIMWVPTISTAGTSKFRALVDALEHDIEGGRLSPGARLPPYRDLALSLGISAGTVSKAYVEAERRGLVRGHVGRGTFVRLDWPGPSRAPVFFSAEEAEAAGTSPALIDISINSPPILAHNIVLAEAFARISGQSELDLHNRYLPYFSHPRHRDAAASWLGEHGVSVSGDEVVLTNGAQHAMAVSIGSIAQPGDVIFTDRLTYPGIISLASHLKVILEPVDDDGEGMLATSLDKAARRSPGKAVYLMPTLQNPTGKTMGLARRQAIADVAVRHGLYVIEDDIYGILDPGGTPPVRSLLPEATFYLTSMAKSVVPSLRVGFLVPPRRKVAEVEAAMRATGWTAAPLMVDVAATLILDGSAERLAGANRREALRRQELARGILSLGLSGEPTPCYHLWLPMPTGWDAGNFAASARMAGVIVTPTEGIRVGDREPGGVRLCLGAARTPAILEVALKRLDAILVGGRQMGVSGLI